METEADSFFIGLQKRQRNLAKKLERIRKKQAEVKATGKEMKEEERKMIESAPQIQDLLAENEKLIDQYKKHLEVSQKEQEKPLPKPEENKTKEIIQFWILGEFLSNPTIKEKFLRENPLEQDVEAFLLFHSQAKGQNGETLNEIISYMEKSIENYLAKSDKIASGTMRTYKKLSEFASRGFSWSLNQKKPSLPEKTELTVQPGPAYSTQIVQNIEKKPAPEEPKVEAKIEVKEEVKQEIKPEIKEEVKQEVKVEVKQEAQYEQAPPKKWADEEEDDEWAEKNDPVVVESSKEESKKGNDDGFIEVTSKKPKKGQHKDEAEEERGRGRGRGRNRGRGRGNFHGERGKNN